MSENKLGAFLTEVSNWNWAEFVEAEKDKSYTSNQAIIFSLVRSCAMRKMDAIKMSIDRLDGKLKTPIRVEYPKIFYLFPNAKLNTGSEAPAVNAPRLPSPQGDDGAGTQGSKAKSQSTPVSGELILPTISFDDARDDEDLPSMSLRDTLSEMANYPRELPEQIIELAQQAEWAVRDHRPPPDEIPRVKSVIAAHLLILGQERNLDAIGSILDQIDGKLTETIQLIGDDIYITNYAHAAPDGAALNADGVLQIEATLSQDLWAQKLGAKRE